MFHSWATLAKSQGTEIVSVEQLKTTVTQLLEGYLQGSWFYINKNRRDRTTLLTELINNAPDTTEIIRLLSTHQQEQAQADVTENQSLLRYIKPLHGFFKHSRLQHTLSSALNLVQAASAENAFSENHLNQLSSIIQQQMAATPSAQESTSIDELKCLLKTSKDKANAHVLLDLLEQVEKRNWGTSHDKPQKF